MTTETIRLFIIRAGDGEPSTVLFDPEATVEKLITEIRGEAAVDEEIFLFKEDEDEFLEVGLTLKQAGIGKGSRLHVHRHRKILVTVHYSDKSPEAEFAPGTTVRRVKKWAEEKFHIHDDDTVEYSLQICGTQTKPPESTHIGSLVSGHDRKLCFDLKPHPKVNG